MITEMVGARGFEPPTPDTPCQCATRLRYAPIVRTPSQPSRLPFDGDIKVGGSISNNLTHSYQYPIYLTFFGKSSFLIDNSARPFRSPSPFSREDRKGKGQDNIQNKRRIMTKNTRTSRAMATLDLPFPIKGS